MELSVTPLPKLQLSTSNFIRSQLGLELEAGPQSLRGSNPGSRGCNSLLPNLQQ
jgi:hypothetical protein